MARRKRGTYVGKPCRTVKDYFNEDWDVYIENRTLAGVTLCEGWPYSMTPRDGIGGRFAHILTLELAEYIKNTQTGVAAKQLGVSTRQITKFKNLMGVQNKIVLRDDTWLLAHQDEILYSSFKRLKDQYGLTRKQVYQHKSWLEELIGEQPGRKRATDSKDAYETWYQQEYEQLQQMSVEQIIEHYKISVFMAKKTYDLVQKNRQQLSYSEQLHAQKEVHKQWLIEQQDLILSTTNTIEQIAEKLGKTPRQILQARTDVRKILNIPTPQTQSTEWILAHKDDFLNLSYAELQEKYQLTDKQVSNRKEKLKKLLNLTGKFEELEQWRKKHRRLILSESLSIATIAKRLNRSEKYIIKTRALLRKRLKERQASSDQAQ